jgi:hypothetical protein
MGNGSKKTTKKKIVRACHATKWYRGRELLTKSNKKKRVVYGNVLRQMEQW